MPLVIASVRADADPADVAVEYSKRPIPGVSIQGWNGHYKEIGLVGTFRAFCADTDAVEALGRRLNADDRVTEWERD